MNLSEIEELPHGVFNELKLLRNVWVSNNRISTIDGLFSHAHAHRRVEYLYLANNHISSIEPGHLDKMRLLRGLDVHGNQLQTIESTTFDALNSVYSIDLSHNNLSRIDEGTFDSKYLRFVSLSHNAISPVASGSFGTALDYVWVTANTNLTCAQIEAEGTLPGGAVCVDEGWCDAKFGVSRLGNMICDERYDRAYATGACVDDGGDCKR